MPERAKLALGAALLFTGVVSGIWFTERLREYPGPPLDVELGALDNATGDASLDRSLRLLLEEGRFRESEDAAVRLEGAVAREERGYRVEARAIEIESGAALAEAAGTASGKEELARSFAELSAELRRKLALAGR